MIFREALTAFLVAARQGAMGMAGLRAFPTGPGPDLSDR